MAVSRITKVTTGLLPGNQMEWIDLRVERSRKLSPFRNIQCCWNRRTKIPRPDGSWNWRTTNH